MDAGVKSHVLSPYLVSFPPHSLRGVIMPILQKCVACPTVKSQKWQRPGTAPGGPCPPHQAGPGQGGSQRKHGLAGKLRSAGIRYKDSKCFYHKRQLRDTLKQGIQNRGMWEQRHKGGASAPGELSCYRQADQRLPAKRTESKAAASTALPINKMTALIWT